MNCKQKRTENQALINSTAKNVFSMEEIEKRITVIKENLKASTWKELETQGKFDKNDKLSFISDNMLIVGCDIGSETHYVRAIDTRGRELSKEPFSFSNSKEGFESARRWMLELAAINNKDQIVMGLEPTGHYWFCIACWMISHGISVVQVNPYAVKQTKEIEDNSQRKDDRKDPKPIANLVKDGNFGIPYIPEGLYAEIRGLSSLRDQLMEGRIQAVNRLHKQLKVYFPEYKDAFGKMDGAFTLEVLMNAPFPADIIRLGTEGIKEMWHKAKLRGAGYRNAERIVSYAENSVGLKDGDKAAKEAVRWFTQQITEIQKELSKIEDELHQKCHEIPNVENVLEIEGLGENILSGIIAEMGDISRFDDVKEIQKISGLGLVECSSGKHKGQTKISHRGRKKLRTWLFQGAKSVVVHSEAFKSLHEHYTTRAENPLKKMQSLIVIACKLLRVVYTLLLTGRKYDSMRMLSDIHYPETSRAKAA